MSVRAAVEKELEFLGAGGSALAETALVLAGELDSKGNSATSKSMCARALREVMDRVRELCPPVEKGDLVDELGSRRSARRATA